MTHTMHHQGIGEPLAGIDPKPFELCLLLCASAYLQQALQSESGAGPSIFHPFCPSFFLETLPIQIFLGGERHVNWNKVACSKLAKSFLIPKPSELGLYLKYTF
ncbi:hypothetical protein NE237_018194 [Protea cynaroides]|uniref:Uncharacterized protein n=1 Tax=Protea cynaroides TaxID=273540 RepID=A0A9Q0QNR9_9MAGN|nr:hypothetical protein NE237_018194 [Protea cynaroides]